MATKKQSDFFADIIKKTSVQKASTYSSQLKDGYKAEPLTLEEKAYRKGYLAARSDLAQPNKWSPKKSSKPKPATKCKGKK